jgi:pyridoxamine 5'-phosphate oxidase
MHSLLEPAPDFDQPLAVLKHCHGKIRKQLATLEKLVAHLPVHGQGVEVQQAATGVLRYFNDAAPNHHADEEQDLLPLLRHVAAGEDAALLQDLLPGIEQEHRLMEAAWAELERGLRQLAAGEPASLPQQEVQRFAQLYGQHMEKEEMHIAPMAQRLFSPQQMHAVGQAMRARRGLGNTGEADVAR